jgi:hypothetical protein
MPRLVRSVVLVCLTALFIAMPSLGAPRQERQPPRLTVSQALARLWTLVFPRPIKGGTILDPHGQCATGPDPACGQQQPGEAGTLIDPSGGN